MTAVPIIALTIGALLLTLGLTSSSRNPDRRKGRDGGDGGTTSGSDGIDGGGDCDGGGGGDGGGCD